MYKVKKIQGTQRSEVGMEHEVPMTEALQSVSGHGVGGRPEGTENR